MGRCPTREQLERLLDEQLDEAERRKIAGHIDGCDRCQETLELLTAGAAGREPAGVARQPAGSRPATPDPDFLTRLKQSAPRSGPDADSAPPGPAAPPVVAGYEILEELGRGGMGVVYKARQVKLNRLVALKMILAGGHAGPRDLARFRIEAEAVARLRHPNIVQVYDVGESEGRPYFALEYVEDGSLVRRLRGDPQPAEPAARLVETLARAVHYAHQNGIVHRDLKPANVLLQRSEVRGQKSDGGGAAKGGGPSGLRPPTSDLRPLTSDLCPKITDFGLAKRLDEASNGTQSGEVVGTPSYMAPEQAAGDLRRVGPAADVYALGAILYELLTGRAPFKGATSLDTVLHVLHEEPVRPGRLRPRLPRDLETVCLKCLEKDPRKRYPSALELADDLERFRHGRPILARPVGPLERAGKWARRRPLTATLLAGMVLSVLLGFGGVAWQWRATLAEKQEKENQRQQAEAARLRARSALYYSRIAQSQLHWRVNDYASARDSLARAALPDRSDGHGWEWHYLQGLFHTALFTLAHADQRPGEVITGRGGSLAIWDGPGGALALSPDGRRVVSLAGNGPGAGPDEPGTVRVWDPHTGAPLHHWPGPGNLHRVVFGPDGRRLALATTDGSVLVWDAQTGKGLLRARPHDGRVTGLAYSPDGRRLASSGWDGTVKLWDAQTGKVIHALGGHRGRVQGVAFHPGGRLLASAGWDRTVTIWDAASGREVRTLAGHRSEVYCVAFSPDGTRLASAGSNGNLRIWDVRSGALVQSVTGNTGAVLSLAYSPDGRFVAYSGLDTTVRVWDAESGVLRILFRGHTAPVEGVQFGPDGRRLVSFSPLQGILKVWDLTRHPEYGTLARTGRDIEALAFGPGGRRMLSLTVGGKLQTWDAATGVLLRERTLRTPPDLTPLSVVACFAPGGGRLAARSAEDASVVRAWDTQGGAEAVAFRGHTLPVCCVRYSADGRRLATCACDVRAAGGPHEVVVWDADTGKPLATRRGSGRLFNVLFSPDGKRLALAGAGGAVSVVDWASGERVFHLPAHKGDVTGLAFSPDGRLLATAGFEDRTVKVWDLGRPDELRGPDPRPRHALPAPSLLCDLAFSPDGQRLAGVSRDLVKMWDPETGQEGLTLRGAPQRQLLDPPFNPRVIFSPDGNRLAASNWDESISVWDAEAPSDDRGLALYQEARRRSADDPERVRFWHLQEAGQCLEHHNAPAARFHLRQLGDAPLREPLQGRKEQLLRRLHGPDPAARPVSRGTPRP